MTKIRETENGTRFLYYEKDGAYYEEYQEYFACCGWRTHSIERISQELYDEYLGGR